MNTIILTLFFLAGLAIILATGGRTFITGLVAAIAVAIGFIFMLGAVALFALPLVLASAEFGTTGALIAAAVYFVGLWLGSAIHDARHPPIATTPITGHQYENEEVPIRKPTCVFWPRK